MKPKSSEANGTPAGVALRLSTFLPYRLNVLAAVVSEGLARDYSEKFGIGVPEWRVLATIGEFGAITAKAIGAHSHMGKVKVSRAVASLESRELIDRAQSSDDKREAMLALTAAGRALYQQVVPLALAYAAKLREGLGVSEYEMLDRLVSKLTAHVRDVGEKR